MPMIDKPPEQPARPEVERARTVLARKWAYLLSGVTVVSLSREELDRELRDNQARRYVI